MRRLWLLGVFLAACLTTGSPAFGAPVKLVEDATLAQQVVIEINATRATYGRSSLRASKTLSRNARQHARSMARLGYFNHSSPEGVPSIRSVSADYAKGSNRWAVGEIMLWVPGRLTARDAVERWLSSAPHRRDLLGRWRHIGVAALSAHPAPGVFDGRDITLVVVNFGRRS